MMVWPEVTERVELGDWFEDEGSWGERPEGLVRTSFGVEEFEVERRFVVPDAVLGPWGDPFSDEEPLGCGVDEVDVCESCQ
jgi:hypothetical protein